MVDASLERYLGEVVARLRAVLGDRLVCVCLIGSGATGDWIAGRSDVDVLVVSASHLSGAEGRGIVEAVRNRALPCPSRCLELVVYREEVVRSPGPLVDFELNLNTGPGMADRVSLDPRTEPRHWFLIDVEMARVHGRSLFGPPVGEVIGPAARADVLAAVAGSIDWYREHEGGSAGAVLNACRAWRYAVDGVWSSKPQAAEWARSHGASPQLITWALEIRAGSGGRSA